MKQNNKHSILFYTLAFAIPALLYTAFLAFEGIMPFGSEYSIAYVDANGQYISFFSYYKQMLSGEQSLLFSFSKLIGGDMIGLGAYYLLSPFNLILLFFPAEKMAQAMAVMAVAKIGTAGLTAAFFFKNLCGINEKSLFLSTSYALMSYNIIYMMNIMWIDGVILLPLIALGIDRIMDGKSSAVYIFSLFYGIFTNYYIGFMLCGASVLYFGWCFVTRRENFKNKIFATGRYAVSSIFAGFMNMVVILPVFASLEGTTKESMPLNELIGLQTQNSFTTIAKHILMPSITMNDIETMLPNVFVGFVVTILCAVFVLLPAVSWRKKIAGSIIAVIFMLSFYFKTLYYFWHGFAKPICFEYRFAFICSFFMLLWAGEVLSLIKGKKILVILLAAINFATLLWYGNANYQACKLNGNGFELFMNEAMPVVEDIKAMEEADGSFYRVEKDYYYNYNDPMALGTAGMTHFSSGEQLATRKAVRAAGYAFTEMYGYYGNGSTIAGDSMFSIKYLMYKDTKRYNLDKVAEYDSISLYKNPYSWPVAIKADQNVTSLDIDSVTTGMLPQELMYYAWGEKLTPADTIEYETTAENTRIYTNEEGLICFEPMDSESDKYVHFTFTVPEDTNIYLNITTDNRTAVRRVICGDLEIKNYPGYYDHGVRYLKSAKAGEEITVSLKLKDTLCAKDVMFLYDNREQLEKMNCLMAENSFKDSGFDGDSLSVEGTMDQSEGILLMIPYNKGWTIKVNGAETDYMPVAENFVYLPVPQGDFTMDISYFPPKLLLGAALSAATLLAALAYLAAEKKKLNKNTAE